MTGEEAVIAKLVADEERDAGLPGDVRVGALDLAARRVRDRGEQEPANQDP